LVRLFERKINILSYAKEKGTRSGRFVKTG